MPEPSQAARRLSSLGAYVCCGCMLLCLQIGAERHTSLDKDPSETVRSASATLQAGMSFPLDESRARYQLLQRLTAESRPLGEAPKPSRDEEEGEAALVEVLPSDTETRRNVANYHVSTRRLGTGSFGDTWQAQDRRTHEFVAIKFFYGKAADNSAVYYDRTDYGQPYLPVKKVKDAVDECTFANSVIDSAEKMCLPGSRAIAACLEQHAEADKFPIDDTSPLYIVMEHGGESLDQWLAQRMQEQKLNINKARMIMKQILQGIEALAAMNKIHHDLKPANIVLTWTSKTTKAGDAIPRVKLIDFGAVIDAGKPAGSTVATAAYAPPEYELGRDFDLPVYSFDIWAAGLIYLEVVCPIKSHTIHTNNARKLFTVEWIMETLKRNGCYAEAFDGYHATRDDVHAIAAMLQPVAGSRTSPTELLGSLYMMEAGFDGEELKVGQPVQYCNKGHGTWMWTKVSEVRGNGIYALADKADACVDKDAVIVHNDLLW